ncbi:SDR family oxidoreductase [Bosea sp. 117]|uniref:SDR family NAD(P)-dependent oxidoreductase n=1 Tax=Bosea sp. 117 TaxID=1125973 RepID=UPI0004941787|nr:SDR family oxidoreductase [Bosea sp. 117]
MAIIVATGSGSGIGAASLRRLVKAGDRVLVHAKDNKAGVEAVAREMQERDAEATTALVDLALPGAGKALIEQAVETFGGLDTIIHAAGFPVRAQVGAAVREDFDGAFGAITLSLFELTSTGMPYLQKSRSGRIVAVSTHNAHVFRNDYPVYPVSGAVKAALEVFARALAIQLAPQGITVNVVAPGLIRKEHGEPFLSPKEWAEFPRVIPMGRIGEPDEVGAMIAFLASEAASYITGQVIHVNGGLC